MVSVIIPAYQAEEFIIKALTSVFQQDYRPIQIIVVNDGSRDGLENTVKYFCDNNELTSSVTTVSEQMTLEKSWGRRNADSNFSLLYLEKINGGPSSARNIGLLAAGGDYVAFLDADDQWHPDKLHKQIDFLEKNKADVVFSDISIEKNNELYVDSVNKRHKWDIPETSEKEFFWFRKLLEYNFVITSTLLIRKECLRKIDWFDETINHGEDYDFVLRLAVFYAFTFYPEPTCRKVFHENNLSHNEIKFYDNKLYILQKVFKKYGHVLGKNNVNYSEQLANTYKNFAYYSYLNKNYAGMFNKYLHHLYYARIATHKMP